MKRRTEKPDLSAYRAMWLFAMFDLPVEPKEARKQYARFRATLLRQGFTMLQFSVYARHCASEDSTVSIRRQIREWLPDHGQVRVIAFTDQQFAKMEVFFGKRRAKAEEPQPQLMLF